MSGRRTMKAAGRGRSALYGVTFLAVLALGQAPVGPGAQEPSDPATVRTTPITEPADPVSPGVVGGEDATPTAVMPRSSPSDDEGVQGDAGDELDAPLALGFQWQSLSRTGTVDLQTGDVAYAISLEALLTFPPDTPALGVHPLLVFTRALDGEGRQLLPKREDIVEAVHGGTPPLGPLDYNNLRQFYGLREGELAATLTGKIANVLHRPDAFSKLEGYAAVRVVTQQRVVDLPLEVSATFSPLVEGMEVRVDEAQRDDRGVRFSVTIAPTAGGDEPMASDRAPLVYRAELVDAAGQPLPEGEATLGTTSVPARLNGVSDGAGSLAGREGDSATEMGGSREGGGRRYAVRAAGKATPAEGREAVAVRVYVATALEDRRVRFELTDVPLP